MNLRETVAFHIARGRASNPDAVTAEDWELDMARYREMCSRFPDYTKGSSFVLDALRDADSALSALEEEGMVVVPYCPPEKAMQKGLTAISWLHRDGEESTVRAVWTAMIDAAEEPSP